MAAGLQELVRQLISLADQMDDALKETFKDLFLTDVLRLGVALPSPMASSSPDWASLPPDVLSEILWWLPVLEGCRFRAVCRCWNNASKNIPSLGGGRPQVPWLMVPVRWGTHHAFYDVSSPSSTFRMTHLPPIRFVAGTSPGGWVLHVDDYGDLHALNILTGENLHAPPLTTFSDVAGVERDARGRVSKYIVNNGRGDHQSYWPPVILCYYTHALIVFPETASRGRYVIVVIHGMFDEIAFAWEGDESWTDVQPRWESGGFLNLLPHNGLIYAVHNNGQILSFDPSGSSFVMLRNPFHRLSGDIKKYVAHCANHLFEFEDRLWMVSREYRYIDNTRRERTYFGRYRRETITTSEVVIYKLDKLAKIWIEVGDFGAGLAMFLGCNQSLVLSTRDFPQLQSAFIYFTDNFWDSYQDEPSVRNVGAFDLEKKAFHVDYHWCRRLEYNPPPVWILR